MTKVIAVLAVSALPALALAQDPKVIEENVVQFTGTIEAISPSTREVMIKVNGQLHTFKMQPDVKRFNELKVGDKLSGSYHEALLMDVRSPGAPAPEPAIEGTKRVPGQAVKPSGALVQQKKATVEVKAIDAAAPSVSVQTAEGKTINFKVQKPERIKGLKVGDKIDITYTEALIVRVE